MGGNFNPSNYGIYEDIINKGSVSINTSDLKKDNLEYNIDCILNILRDGIEKESIQKARVYIKFVDGQQIYLSVFDYYVNLIMWRSILFVGEEIHSKHIFFAHNTERSVIKRYFDIHIIGPYKDKLSNKIINNILADTLDEFKSIDEFSLYLANTINIEDDIRLMNENPRAKELYHTSLAGVPLEDVKKVGMERAEELVSLIKDSGYHAMADYFKSNEGIDSRQYREYAINIGTKPDGQGSVFPTVVDTSYIRGGLNTVESMFIESSAGRTSQILSKTNVGDSGHFARLLGLNNSDTILHHDHKYVCDSVNFQEVFIKDSGILKNLLDRFYRVTPNGMEYLITENDGHLIGTTIYLRSPMTCMSHARGEGICYRCYGRLAYTNADINIGKMAAEEISSRLTQRMLSAKHLLEPMIKRITWAEGFSDYFAIDTNVIYMKHDKGSVNGYKLRIDPNGIIRESDLDDYEYNEYINEFEVVKPDGSTLELYSDQSSELYISCDLNDTIREKAIAIDEMIEIDFDDLIGKPLFMLQIHNNELSATLELIKAIINRLKDTLSFDRHGILQALIETMREGGINVTSVHAEIILSNQISDAEDVISKPNWTIYNPEYQLQTLDRALKFNPSIIVSLSYENISTTLYNPLTYRRKGVSFMDLFFMESPKKYLENQPNIKYINNEIFED